jgi:hypothetical protein
MCGFNLGNDWLILRIFLLFRSFVDSITKMLHRTVCAIELLAFVVTSVSVTFGSASQKLQHNWKSLTNAVDQLGFRTTNKIPSGDYETRRKRCRRKSWKFYANPVSRATVGHHGVGVHPETDELRRAAGVSA